MKHHGLPSGVIDLVKMLGINGMSSESSDGDIGGNDRTYLVKRLPWRSDELTTWLHRIDALPRKNRVGVNLTHYTVSRKRELSDLESVRPPRRRLPVNFYDREWMSQQDDRSRARLGINVHVFNLPKLDQFLR
jgi:hypothetical protein